MSGTAKWLIVGSVLVIAVVALIALIFFVWMVLRSPMMGGFGAPGWGMPHMGSLGNAWSGSRGPGMMSGGYGMVGGGSGMMGFSAPQSGDGLAGEKLTVEVVEEQLTGFLGDRSDLAIAEIMIFDNHAYAEIVETDTGIGAMELLVDPGSLAVYPEHGPNMMWNVKYGMHGGGMMGFGLGGVDPGDMTVSPDEAVAYAQSYLDRTRSGLSADDHAAPFYGYYTIHTLREGEVVGMLSVNGYSGDVFLHTWHGTLLEMTESEHE